MEGLRELKLMVSLLIYIYIYIYIKFDYGAMHSADRLVLWNDSSFSKFKWSIQLYKIIFVWISRCRPNFMFFKKILLFLSYLKINWFSYYESFKKDNFLTILKNSKKIQKNIKFSLRRYIHINIILYGWIDHLYLNNEEPIHDTRAICVMHSTITQLSLYI
jgi:hypothetical protein